ncbi:MAG: transposase [Ignavibacteria bacterium]|nr:transposase [Ignavibacteria bacterium]
MKYDPHIHHRRSIRLKGYDYSLPGGYFVTICVRHRECLLGEITTDGIRLSEYGLLVDEAWRDLPNHYRHVQLDQFVVMPNHVHGIIFLINDNTVGTGSEPVPTGAIDTTKRHPLSEIVRSFKTFSARRINSVRGVRGVPLWQRNYFEHIIRDERDLNRIRQYIIDNPTRWLYDRNNPFIRKMHRTGDKSSQFP